MSHHADGGKAGVTQGGLIGRSIWGVDGHYSSECVAGLLDMWGGDTGDLLVSWAQRRNERGKVVCCISVAGERSKIDTLDSKKEFLETRGWRLAQEQDGQNGQGNGMGVGATSTPRTMLQPP